MPGLARNAIAAAALAGTALGANEVNLTAQEWWEGMPPGTIKFLPVGKCTSGSTAYVGILNPKELTQPDGFFTEIMGGAVCFSKDSCADESLSMWIDIHDFIIMAGASEEEWAGLSSGAAVPISMLAGLNPGWLPGIYDGHVLDGRRGLYFPTCSADINVGRHTLMDGGSTFFHHGGQNLYHALQRSHEELPGLRDIAIYGGSGGGTAAAAWMEVIADMWPAADVRVLVDSGMHLLPGGLIFQHFYKSIAWANNPSNQANIDDTDAVVPDFDWNEVTAIANTLNKFDGRVKIAYIQCKNDHIMFSDREKIAKYITDFNTSTVDQDEEMWSFLTTTHKCAQPGTMSSYVVDCNHHHLTRQDGALWAQGQEDPVHAATQITGFPLGPWVSNFFEKKPYDANMPTRTDFWFEAHDIDMEGSSCNLEIGAAPGAGLLGFAALFPAVLGQYMLW